MKNQRSRFEVVSRRNLLIRSAVIGALVTVPGLACGSSDQDVLGNATITTVATTDAGTSPASSATASTTPVTTSPTTTSALATSGATFPGGGELVVDFSFTPTSDRAQNPYIAVWVEDADGNLVRTISVWFEQSTKGELT